MIVALLLMAIELPQLGTVGDLPPADNRAVLEIDHTGAMKLDGKELRLVQLRGGQLKKFKNGTNFLLRVDRRVPYGAVHWVRVVFAEWGFDRMFYAVLPLKGDKMGAFALFAPRDHRRRALSFRAKAPSEYLRLRTVIAASETTANLAAFASGLRSMIKDPKHKKMAPVLHVKSVRYVPWGLFLKVLDVGLRSGVTQISIDSTEVPKRDADLRKLVRDLAKSNPNRPNSFDVRLKGAPLDRLVPVKPAPKVARVSGAFAGYFKPEQFDVDEEEELEEVEPNESTSRPAPRSVPAPTKEPKPK